MTKLYYTTTRKAWLQLLDHWRWYARRHGNESYVQQEMRYARVRLALLRTLYYKNNAVRAYKPRSGVLR